MQVVFSLSEENSSTAEATWVKVIDDDWQAGAQNLEASEEYSPDGNNNNNTANHRQRLSTYSGRADTGSWISKSKSGQDSYTTDKHRFGVHVGTRGGCESDNWRMRESTVVIHQSRLKSWRKELPQKLTGSCLSHSNIVKLDPNEDNDSNDNENKTSSDSSSCDDDYVDICDNDGHTYDNTSTDTLEGTIERMSSTMGYIIPVSTHKVQHDIPVKSIQSYINTALYGMVKLKVGDLVSFLSNHHAKDEPAAMHVKLVKLNRRTSGEVEEYLAEVCSKLDRVDQPGEAVGGLFNINETVLTLLCAKPVWEHICNGKSLSPKSTLLLLLLVVMLKDSCTGLDEHFKQFLSIISSSRLLEYHTGHVKMFIDAKVEIVSSKESFAGKCIEWLYIMKTFLKIIISYDPKKTLVVVQLLTPIIKNNLCSAGFVHDLFLFASKNLSEDNNMEWHELSTTPSIEELLKGPFNSGQKLHPMRQTQ